MGERKTQTMVLGTPKPFPTKKGTGYEFVNLDGEGFSCFDQAFVDAFAKHELKGKEHAYVYETSDNPKWKPTLRSIPGVYEGQSGWKGGARAAGLMFTDAQVAALAASYLVVGVGEDSDFVMVADVVLAWLKGSVPATSSPTAKPEASRKAAAPVANGNGVGEHLMTLAAMAFPDRPALAEAYLQTASKKYGVPIPELSDEQAGAVAEDLERIGATRAGGE